MARRLTASATINGVDDETFGSNEFGHAEFTRETILSDAQPQNVMRMQCRWGGECRVELDLTGQQTDGGDVRISGVASLFEGTSENTNDLDGRTEFTFLVPRGVTVSNSQRVDNTDESGDFATIVLTVNNALIETSTQALTAGEPGLIRGVLLAGKFRTQRELNTMSHDGQRNTLIVELAGRSKQAALQSFDDVTLAGMGAVLVFLRTARIRDDAALKGMTADDMRNVLIVELGAQTQMSGSALQGMSNIELVLLGLGKPQPGGLTPGSFIRGVLLAGQFRTQHELNKMSPDDQRNTLIVEMTGHSNQTNFQAFNDFDLAGAGAVMVFLRGARIRRDGELKKMSADDQRNTAIVEIGSQTNLGSKLQGLRNMDLIRIALGVSPETIFKQPA